VPPATTVDLPLWRALGLAPLVSGLTGSGGWLVAATSTAVLLAALMLGMRARPAVVAALVAVWAVSSLGAWAVADYPLLGLWPPALLLPAVLAQSGLGILAARWLADSLGAYAFGLRQLATVAASVVLLLGLGGGMLRVASGPWDGLRRDPELLPAFVSADAERVGPYRVVQLEESEGIVRWDVTDAQGPAMLAFGTVPAADMSALLDGAIGATVSGVDPSGGAALGRGNVRYVVIAEGAASPQLVAAINRQPALEPLPAGDVRVWRVLAWLPRASVLPADRAAALQELGDPGDTRPFEADRLERTRPDRFAGENPRPEGGLLVVSEGSPGDWRGLADARQPLERVDLGDIVGFTVSRGPSGSPSGARG
jgi:hypothetical protein